MTHRIEGLKRGPFGEYFGRSDEEPPAMGALRVIAGSDDGYRRRVSLKDACEGGALVPLNFIGGDVPGPCRTAYAIFMRKGKARSEASEVKASAGRLLPALRRGEPRGFRAGIAVLFARAAVGYIHEHHAVHGCLASPMGRAGDEQ